MRKIIIGLLLTVFIAIPLTLAFTIKSAKGVQIVVPDNYPTIQKAINSAHQGDTIYVRTGTYYEHVVVNKTVNLVGENKSATIIDGNISGDVVKITANNVAMSGFTIQRSGSWFSCGILLKFCNGANISDNIIVSNSWGIRTEFSYDNIIADNEVWHNTYGIWLWSDRNTLKGNIIHNNELNFGVDSAYNYVDTSNTINGKPVYYWINQSNKQIPSDAGFVALVNSSRISVKNLELKDNVNGIIIAYSNNILIQNVTFRHDRLGIWLDHSVNNTIIDNNLVGDEYNFDAEASSGNRIFHNNFINTELDWNGWVDARYPNSWDSGYPSGGNYWSDYTGKDLYSGSYQNESGSDGIGDSSLQMPVQDLQWPNENNTDRYPLMAPVNSYNAGTWNNTSYSVGIVSNSTITSFDFNPSSNPPTLALNVTGTSGTRGFCRVAIPTGLMWVDTPSEWVVTVGGTLYGNETITQSGNYTYIYFTYTHSTKTVQIQSTYAVPEFQSLLILSLLTTATLLAAFGFKKKTKPTQKSTN